MVTTAVVVILSQKNWIGSWITVQFGHSWWAGSSSQSILDDGSYIPLPGWNSKLLFCCSTHCFWKVPTCFQQWKQHAQELFYCHKISFLFLLRGNHGPRCQLYWQCSGLISETQANYNMLASSSCSEQRLEYLLCLSNYRPENHVEWFPVRCQSLDIDTRFYFFIYNVHYCLSGPLVAGATNGLQRLKQSIFYHFLSLDHLVFQFNCP